MPSKLFDEAYKAAKAQHKRNMTLKVRKKKESELDDLRFQAKKMQLVQRASRGLPVRRRKSRGRRW
jgi:hypothetical protein